MESESNKLFVGGITHGTSATNLRDYFTKYGEVKNVQVMRNRVTGTSRGFGFVSFSDNSSMERALQNEEHQILGRRVAVNIPRPIEKKAALREVSLNQNTCPSKINKIFVGGLPSSLTKEEFDRYFETFGRITDSVIMYNKQNNNPRGFGFVTYDSEESVQKVVMERSHQLSNKWVDVKRAIPRGDQAPIKFSPHDSYQVSWGALPFSSCYLRPAGSSIDGYYAYANQMTSNMHYPGQQLWLNHPNFGFYPSYYYNTPFGRLGNSYVDPTYMDYRVDGNGRQGGDGPPSSGSSSITKSVTIQEAEDVENEASGKLNDEVSLEYMAKSVMVVENGASGKPDDEISHLVVHVDGVVEAVSDCSSSESPVVVDNGVSGTGMTNNEVSKVIVDGNGDVNGHASEEFTSVYDQ